ncbi:MAG: anaerobic ribonucleoside-triphosphate reductase activating protein [Candidatus Moranbacteria bacterium]|nr:anaerobic ribonucleoside-triphosphate reductase activating protein [Candidatus Moranbacteria bacterium]
MILGGFQKLTLLDYPGKIAATVFTVGCSFRCPFCHNPELVDLRLAHNEESEKEFFEFLAKRKGKLEGICITGGEPTIQPDIIEFIKKIKKEGFLVKLDSNGTRPDVLKKLFDQGLLDYVAMDIKSSLDNYDKVTGSKVDKDRIRISVNLIMNSGIPYEFRTTAVPGLHTEEDFDEIAKWISGARNYYLQEYREEQKILDPSLKLKTKGRKIDLEKIQKKIGKNFGRMGIRR